MAILAALLCLLMLLALACADLFIEGINPDDLSNMGIQLN